MKQSYEQLGKNIAYYRRRAGMTQDMLANVLSVTMQAVSKWERNLSCPDMSYLPTLASTLGISIDDLFEIRDENSEQEIIENIPWDNDEQYRLALFYGKVLLVKQTIICKTDSDLIAHIKIPKTIEEVTIDGQRADRKEKIPNGK